MRIRRRSDRAAVRVVALTLLLVAGPRIESASGNLLSNGGFDGGIAGWDSALSGGSFSVALTWSEAADRNGTPGSGAGILQNLSSGGLEIGTYPLFANGCFAVAPTDEVKLRGYVLIPSGQTRTGFARFDIAWYSTPSCLGFLEYGDVVSETTADATWHLLDNTLIPPANAQAFRIGLTVLKYEAGGTFTARFDDVDVLAPEPATAAASTAMLASLAVLAKVRRRSRMR